MKSFVFVCLVGALAIPLRASAQDQTPVAPSIQQGQQPPTAPVAQGQPGQQGGRGRGGMAPTPAPSQPEPARGGRGAAFEERSSQNVRVELSLTDTLTAESSTKKTVTMLIADGQGGSIRSAANSGIQLNVDAGPRVRADGRIYLTLSIQYLPDVPTSASRTPANLIESLSVIVTDGKPLLVSQSADPKSDRKVTVEVTTTIVK